ncbi:MAG: glucose-6-phosphate dehydrogenase assembly protein OpcA [Candidatus Limnocylindria bacterium]
MAADLMDGVWSAERTSPGEIEEGLRDLLHGSPAGKRPSASARVLNLVAVVDRGRREEIEDRLARVGRYHPSRTIICAVEPERTTLDARAAVEGSRDRGGLSRERVTIDLGDKHLAHLDTIIDPILVSGLATVVWAPHGHPGAVDALLRLATVVLVDSLEEPEIAASLARVAELAERAYVVDLAWLRSTPWRERVAFTFDPAPWRTELPQISAVTVRHRADSAIAALLLVGWLSSRLGWEPAALVPDGKGGLRGRAHSVRRAVEVALEADDALDVPGLAGLTLETRSGLTLSLDRAPGGLAATRTTLGGRPSSWTVLGASRGESGILGEGVRQALLRDPTYRPAAEAARAMVP